MVHEQIERRGLRDARLLDAFRQTPRHEFVPQGLRSRAYNDGPLPIGDGQTISQPYIVALMTSLLMLTGSENVLEIGTGSGYQAAILARMAATVHTVERIPALAEQAARNLLPLGLANITFHSGDGTLGWPETAPYDAIVVTAAAPDPPDPLIAQLAESGRLVIPIGGRYGQDLQVWTKTNHRMDFESILPVAFVPLRGKHGWLNGW